MRTKAFGRSRRDTGQVLVVFALGLMSMVAGLALILDGGNAYVQQRRAQPTSSIGWPACTCAPTGT